MKWIQLMVGCVCAVFVSQAQTLSSLEPYADYRLFEVKAFKERPKLLAINDMKDRQNETKSGFIFFDDVITSRSDTRLIVSKAQQGSVEAELDELGIDYDIKEENVKDLLEKWEVEMNMKLKSEYNAGDALNFFPNLNEMMLHIRDLTSKSSKASSISIGRSYEKRQIPVIKVNEGSNLPLIVLDAGSDPRKWMSPAAVLNFVHQLLYSEDQEIKSLRNDYRWHILPNLNPDGYHHTWTEDRFWRKSRSKHDEALKTRKTNAECCGVDLKRNWDAPMFHSGPEDPCSPMYKGPKPFSEVETKLLRKILMKHKKEISVYLSVQSHGQALIVPGMMQGFMKNDKLDEYERVSQNVVNEIKSMESQTEYKFGIAYNNKYPVPGMSIDWAFHDKTIDELTGKVVADKSKDKPRLPWAFALDLPPGSSGDSNWIPVSDPPSDIPKRGKEITRLMVALCRKIKTQRGEIKKDEL